MTSLVSGSPILQNGKLIGAVTHVMVNEPTKGYGILIENMLAQAVASRRGGAARAAPPSLRTPARGAKIEVKPAVQLRRQTGQLRHGPLSRRPAGRRRMYAKEGA